MSYDIGSLQTALDRTLASADINRVFDDFAEALERAHRAARLVSPTKGCQVGASLLALELDRNGAAVEYLTGSYSRAPELVHSWVLAEGIVLDPTRDQFNEDPLAEHYLGRYCATSRRPASEMPAEATRALGMVWAADSPLRAAVAEVAEHYDLDQSEIEEPPGPLFVPGER